MANQRILLTGASGLLGRALYSQLNDGPNWDVLGLAFSRSSDRLQNVDLTNLEEVATVLETFKPTVVIHAAAERRPDIVEKQELATKQLNVQATSYLCQEAAKIGAIVIYISTDYVFDGKNAPYDVDDEPNPLNKYGASKLQGEHMVLEYKGNIVMRVPILYGKIENLDESAVTTLFAKVKDTGKQCKMCAYLRRFPTHCDDVAKVILDLVRKRMEDSTLTGIFHWSGDECMTKYEMAVTMADLFGLESSHILPDMSAAQDTGTTTRPYDANLDASRLENLGICHRQPFKEGIKSCLYPFRP